MKVVLPGGTGQVGAILDRALTAAGHDVTVLTRSPRRARETGWDGATLGPWAAAIDGCDAVINLAGRSVSCRYTPENLRAMMDSRVDSARVVGEAIAAAARPPRVWLQMSTATVYAHRFDAANDEATGVIGGAEPGVPDYWAYSVEIARNWERAQAEAATPATRKVILRSAMVMSPDRGGVFDVLSRLTGLGLGGPVAGGAQYVSWIHDEDFVRAVEFLIDREDLEGPVNLSSPGPLPHRDFMRALRTAWRVPVGLPATRWMAELGAFAMRSDTELLFKSRRVVPGRLREAGFTFSHPEWEKAAVSLVRRARSARSGAADGYGADSDSSSGSSSGSDNSAASGDGLGLQSRPA
ncbi:TIGR01777 family oxidoreductase [Streptomyces sp. NPDC007084]|uniref:TIGR01777 family oxidoreductase n=1 Tax=Streptomyces sp. NPDC007084 TaxID=3154313 RepID=UPI0034559BDA